MAEAVYLLCALTSLIAAGLLLRSYLQNRVRLLLWSALGFVGLAINNVILFIDLVVVVNIPNLDLTIYRLGSALIGVLILLYGLIWDSR